MLKPTSKIQKFSFPSHALCIFQILFLILEYCFLLLQPTLGLGLSYRSPLTFYLPRKPSCHHSFLGAFPPGDPPSLSVIGVLILSPHTQYANSLFILRSLLDYQTPPVRDNDFFIPLNLVSSCKNERLLFFFYLRGLP